MAKVLVIGGAGEVGSIVSRYLLEEGHEVSLLVKRNPDSISKASSLVDLAEKISSQLPEEDRKELLRIVLGDLTKPSSVANATYDIDYIVATAAALDDSLNEGYQTVFENASQTGVKHIVFVSNRSEDGDQNIPLLAAKTKIHKMLRESGVPYTILKFDAFVGTMKSIIDTTLQYGSVFPVYAPEGTDVHNFGKHYWISEQKVALVTAGLVGNEDAYGKTIQVGGQEAYTLMEFIRRYGVERGETIKTVVASSPLPGHEPYFQILEYFYRYDSPKPDDLSPYSE